MYPTRPPFAEVIDAGLAPGSVLVELRGIVDLQARAELCAAATRIVAAQPSTIHVDLGAATYFGPEGLRFLANLARCEAGPACAVTVVRASSTARRALCVTGFAHLLDPDCRIAITAAAGKVVHVVTVRLPP
jgi:hypothetical protein